MRDVHTWTLKEHIEIRGTEASASKASSSCTRTCVDELWVYIHRRAVQKEGNQPLSASVIVAARSRRENQPLAAKCPKQTHACVPLNLLLLLVLLQWAKSDQKRTGWGACVRDYFSERQTDMGQEVKDGAHTD